MKANLFKVNLALIVIAAIILSVPATEEAVRSSPKAVITIQYSTYCYSFSTESVDCGKDAENVSCGHVTANQYPNG